MGKDRDMPPAPQTTVREKKTRPGHSYSATSTTPTNEQKYPDEIVPDRQFKDLHHPLIKAIWNVDRFQPDLNEKLKELRQLVIKNGMNPNCSCDILHDITGQPIAQATPLLIACFEGDADVIKFFIENGADPNQAESEHHLSPLHVVCDAEYHGQTLRQKDRAEIVKLLLRKNANVNHLDRSSMAAIHKAVIHDRPECVEALMDGKADPNVAYIGDTPLSIAARHNRERICQILLNYKETNVNHRNEQGGTPLHFACAALVDSPTCVEMLVRNGAKINTQDLKLNTAAMVCAFFNKPKILQYLIREGADITVRNNEGKDALDVAVEKEFYECRDLIQKALDKQGGSRSPGGKNDLATDFESKTKIR